MRNPNPNMRKEQAMRLLQSKRKDDTNLVTLANKVVEGVAAWKKLKAKTLEAQGKEEVVEKKELDPKAGYTLSHVEGPHWMSSKDIHVTAHHKGKQIGYASIKVGRKYSTAKDTRVHEDHRRKGVATAMYQHAEKITGTRLKPSKDKTTEGTKLWQGTRGQSTSGHGPFGRQVQRVRKNDPEGKEKEDGDRHIAKKEGEFIHLEHYSDKKVDTIDPKFHGKGVSGNERKRKTHPNWVDRSYHYEAGSKPEADLGSKKYKHTSKVPAHKIYDMANDHKGFTKNPVDKQGFRSVNVVEHRIKAAGYHGFKNSNSSLSNAVALFHPVKPHKVEENKPSDIKKSEGPKKFSIISGEQPRGPVKATKPLEHHLKEAGYKYHKLQGKYGGKKETSYMVENADPKHIEHLGHQHGQESVIHSDGKNHKLVYTHGDKKGQHHKGTGITFHDKEPKDNYSKLGNQHFTLNLDFGKLHKNESFNSKPQDHGFSSHGKWAPLKDIHHVETEERGNAWPISSHVDHNKHEAIWVNHSKSKANTKRYGDQKHVNLRGAKPVMSDGDGGHLYIRSKVQKSLSKNDPVQKEIKWRGLDIAIEWPKGSTRQYGKQYKKKMRCHYGYFKGIMGDDGEELDVYIGDNLHSGSIFLIPQLKRKDGSYDEEKIMIGFDNAKQAADAYTDHMDEEQFGGIKEIDIKEVKKRLTKSLMKSLVKTIAVDFDGTIVEDKFPDIGPLKPHVLHALTEMHSAGYNILIYSARSSEDGKASEAMKKFIKDDPVLNEIATVYEGKGKPMAAHYIDDKAIKFDDNWREVMDIVLEKGIKHTMAAFGAAAAMMVPHAVTPHADVRTSITKPAPKVEQRIKKPEQKKEKGFGFKPRGNHMHDRFLQSIMQVESGGGKYVNHKEIKSGLHAGTKALGRFGLMPKTLEDVGRWSKNKHVKELGSMKPEKMAEHIKNHPEVGREAAREYAHKLHMKFKGNKAQMAHAWFNGPNTGASSEQANQHWYVKRFMRHHKTSSTEPTQVAQKSDTTQTDIIKKAQKLKMIVASSNSDS